VYTDLGTKQLFFEIFKKKIFFPITKAKASFLEYMQCICLCDTTDSAKIRFIEYLCEIGTILELTSYQEPNRGSSEEEKKGGAKISCH
jgi:hypothetical protein